MPGTAPNLPVLVYDGDCGFCTASADRIRPHLHEPATVQPGQVLDLPALGLTDDDVTSAAWWVDESGRRWRGHAAIGKALIAAGGWRRVIGQLLIVPPLSWLARPVYAWVARNRGRLPGATDSCRVQR